MHIERVLDSSVYTVTDQLKKYLLKRGATSLDKNSIEIKNLKESTVNINIQQGTIFTEKN